MTTPPEPFKSHVDRLVKRCAGKTSVRELERINNLSEGALGNHIIPTRGADGEIKIAKIAIMERFADVLGVGFDEVSQAFMLDAGLTVGPAGVPTPDEAELLDIYRALGPADKVRMCEHGVLLRRVAEKFPDCNS